MYAEMFLSQLISVWFFVGNVDDFGSQCVAKKPFGRWIDSMKYSQARWWLQPTAHVEQMFLWTNEREIQPKLTIKKSRNSNAAKSNDERIHQTYSVEYVSHQHNRTPIIMRMEMKMKMKKRNRILVLSVRCKRALTLYKLERHTANSRNASRRADSIRTFCLFYWLNF